MNCYGIGLTRLLGTIAEIYHDDHGLVWPDRVAPFRAHLLTLPAKDSALDYQITVTAQKNLLRFTKKRKITVLYDDRPGISAGEKFNDADLLGMPYRIVLSGKTLANNCAEIKRRDAQDIALIKLTK